MTLPSFLSFALLTTAVGCAPPHRLTSVVDGSTASRPPVARVLEADDPLSIDALALFTRTVGSAAVEPVDAGRADPHAGHHHHPARTDQHPTPVDGGAP